MTMQNQQKQTLCREYAAEYLGISSATLKKLPIPYTQYTRFSYALYQVEDLDNFRKERTFIPSQEEEKAA